MAKTVTIGEQKVFPESESLKFSATPTPQVENPSDSSTPTPQPWFLVILLLLVRNNVIQLVEHDTSASLGLLRTVANFFKTLNRQISFLKQTNIP